MTSIIIDIDKWTTQQKKAESYTKAKGGKGVSIQYISKLIKQGKLESKPIEELGLVLVER